MKIVLNNAVEAGMTEPQISHCQQLIAWRIEQKFESLPQPGDDITILYSEKDPLMESEEVDHNAYFIYFSVDRVEPSPATVYVNLIF